MFGFHAQTVYDVGVAQLTKSGITALLCLAAWIAVAQEADRRWVVGTYRNPALGYSVTVPRGLKGITGDQAGPERGLRISLRSGGVISVWGEPNSLEWKNPEQGVRSTLSEEKCASGQQDVSTTRIGKLNAATGTLVCSGRVLKTFLVFRSGGGPIYWLRLETTSAHKLQDEAALDSVAASFNLIPWE
jgi:hypothetical protein